MALMFTDVYRSLGTPDISTTEASDGLIGSLLLLIFGFPIMLLLLTIVAGVIGLAAIVIIDYIYPESLQKVDDLENSKDKLA